MKTAKLLLKGLALAAAAALAGLIIYGRMSSPPGKGIHNEFRLERGWGVRTVAEALEDSSIVRSRFVVLLRYRTAFRGMPLQAGRYSLDDSMEVDSVLTIFVNGDVIPVPTHWVTIPPGLRMEESMAVLAASLECLPEEVNGLASDSAFLLSLGVHSLEGYLFPETYEFADTLSIRQVVSRVVSTGMRVMDTAWEERLGALGLTPFHGLILASIVEREAASDTERELIAGVFLSRLRRGMRLESCATVQYALGEVRERLLYSDLETESPYNTYRNSGLPPGPICSPGAPSLLAVANPDTTEGYLFFVARGDGSGEHLFARTASGHAANIRLVR
jgi:UPF0755 protein